MKLNNIEFNAKENGSSKMSTGWLNVTDLLYVKCLQLRKIKIVEIEDDAFAVDTFSKLEHLNIVYVPLEILNPKSFNGLKQLRTLFLRGLNLITFQENLLSTMSSLKSFVIIECGPRIMYIDNLFGYTIMPNLNEIQIYNCILKDTITEKTFKSTPSVSSLVLVACSIEKIGPKSFDPIVNGLRFLHLGFNQLKSLPDDLFNTNHQIFINVNSNPWHCDCQIDKMRQFAQTKTNVHFNGFICVTPQEYNDVPLIGCPSLCKENTTLTTDSDLLDDIVEEMDEMDEIEEMEALTNRYQLMETGTRSENEPIDSNVKKPLPTMISSSVKITKKSIYVTCEISASEKLKKMIELTRPTRKNLPAFRTKCGELHIYTESLANNFKLIELNYIAKNNNENQSIEFEGKMFNNNKQCRSYFKDTGMKRLKIKRKLRANLFYHFCWIKKDSNTIVPLNCVAFYSGPNERGSFGGGGLDAWIMKSKMPIIIVCFILTVIFAIFIGTVEAFLLAQIFPKKIRGRMSDLKKSSSNPNSQNRGVDTLKVQETVNRPKYVRFRQ